MKYWSEISRRNRTVVVLFTVMVLLPSIFLTTLSLRTIRTEDAREKVQRSQRQTQIAQLLNADLNKWLFSPGPDGGSSEGLLRFKVDDIGRVTFPGLEFPVSTNTRNGPLPSSLRDGEIALGDEPVNDAARVEQIYYPRIEAFLRDLKAGNNSGAQYFRRLRALIVLLQDRNGYVLGASRLRQRLSSRLAELAANESFRASISIPETNESTAPVGDAVALESFPAFYVTFSVDESEGFANLRINVFRYSIVLLLVVTVVGVIFMYRAASHEATVSQLQANFVSIVSHEFRTPLSSILALSERLESSRVTEKQQLHEYHSTLRRDAKRLSTLIDKLLDFAQLEEGKKRFASTKLNLFLAAEEAVNAFRQAGTLQQVEIIDRVDDHALEVSGDRTAIIQCLSNLIENAIKYSEPGAPVEVRCGGDSSGTWVEVRDHGIGIPVPDQQKVFDKFYRAPNARSLSAQGTGIGLAVVRRIMDAHNGSVTVESKPGEGSRFRLVFPDER